MHLTENDSVIFSNATMTLIDKKCNLLQELQTSWLIGPESQAQVTEVMSCTSNLTNDLNCVTEVW